VTAAAVVLACYLAIVVAVAAGTFSRRDVP
jgi:hypothetical protein